ncbi:MAG: long-chain fatty acid transport protein [Myxococcota bacterium]|jgi:long-chain fatty acid transport protein
MIPFLLLTADASAAGYYLMDSGTRGVTRAGAFVAGVNDLSAQYYNPAGLIRLDETQVFVNVSMVSQKVDFTRIDYDSSGNIDYTYDPVENEDPAMPIPMMGFSSRFGLENTVFAFGLYTPSAPTLGYPEEGAQRYSLIDSLILKGSLGPSVAHRFNDWLTVGAGVAATFVSADYALTLTTCGDTNVCGGTEAAPAGDPTYDVDIVLAMTDPVRFDWNMGLLVEPTDTLAIGFSMNPPMNVSGSGSIVADFGEDHYLVTNDLLTESSFSDDQVTVLQTLPWIFRLGAAVSPNDRMQIELAGVYETWGNTEETVVTDVQLEMGLNAESTLLALAGDAEIPESVVVEDDIILPLGFSNTWSIRLGGDFALTDTITARGGVGYETSAVPPETQSVASVDGNKIILGLGGTITLLDRMDLDLGFAQSRLQARSIKNSEVRQIVIPLFPIPLAELDTHFTDLGIDEGDVIGNGEFSSHATFMTAGLTYRFGT